MSTLVIVLNVISAIGIICFIIADIKKKQKKDKESK